MFLVSLVSAILFNFQVQHNLESDYRRARQLILDRNEHIVRQGMSTMRQSMLRTRRMIELLLLDRVRQQGAVTVDYGALLMLLWREVAEDFAISRLMLSDAGGRVLAGYRRGDGDGTSGGDWQTMPEMLRNRHRYPEFVECLDACIYHVYGELHLPDGTSLYLVVGYEIAGMVDSFALLTGIDMLLLHRGSNRSASGLRSGLFAGFIEYSTNSLRILPLMRWLDEQRDWNRVDLRQVYFDTRVFEVSLIPSEFSEFSFIAMADITGPFRGLQASKHSALLMLGLIFLLLFLLMYFLLKAPLNELRLLGRSIPMLGQGEFRRFRQVLGVPDGSRNDELSRIHHTAYNVSIHLQELESELLEKARCLSETLELKSRQYAYLRSLLNYSQVMVVVHDASHRVTMFNDFCHRYLAAGQPVAEGISMTRLFGAAAGEAILQALQDPDGESVHMEHRISSPHGNFWISWIHCRLPQDAWLSIGIDVTGRREAEEKIKFVAEHDLLTGLFNRWTFTSRLRQLISRSEARAGKSGGRELVLFFIDLDKFKQINDRLGHASGDRYLRKVAAILAQHVREPCFAGRIGGDEFAVVLRGLGREQCLQLAGVLVREVNTLQQREFDIGIQTSLSIGVAFYPEHARTEDELVTKADLAMYRAKKSLDRRICIYSSDIQDLIVTNLDKRNFLYHLIAGDRFEIYLQPVFNLDSDQVYYYECLSRVAGISIKLPQVFRYAEECGLAGELDLYVIEKLCAAIRQLSACHSSVWNAATAPCFGINISALSLSLTDFQARVQQLFERYRLNGRQVIFEITETSEILNLDKALQFMQGMRSYGVGFALDDFGDGFATLRYLRRLPFDVVKIDGQFILNVDRDVRDQVIVDTLVSMATRFGQRVVVECVETAAIHDYLQRAGVSLMQGNYLAPPMPLRQVLLAAGDGVTG
ncbi:MAG: EAL domain-containing protein [Thiothrix sp.]|nr:EAL domain-containing protein [Thiothrix sp.]